jgi:hypothetical protein
VVVWLTRQIWHSLTMLQNPHKFSRNPVVMKATLLLRPKQFASLSGLLLRRGNSNMRRNTPSPCATTYASLSKSGCNEGHITFEPETVFLPYPAWFWSRVTRAWPVTLPHHAPQTLRVWPKSGSKEGHFTLEAETFFSTLPRVVFELGDSNMTRDPPFPCSRSYGRLDETGK